MRMNSSVHMHILCLYMFNLHANAKVKDVVPPFIFLIETNPTNQSIKVIGNKKLIEMVQKGPFYRY